MAELDQDVERILNAVRLSPEEVRATARQLAALVRRQLVKKPEKPAK